MKSVSLALTSLVVASCLTGCASELHTGHLVVTLTDKETGGPITNATVVVEAQIKPIGYLAVTDKCYLKTSVQTDTNGVANVEFQHLPSTSFDWGVKTPSHHSNRFYSLNERFGAVVEESDYTNIDTNTVDGLAKYNEIKALYESDDPSDYETFVRKFEPKSVTYTNNVIYRSASFYPKHNPQPMYSYNGERNFEWYLSQGENVVATNGQSLISYRTAEVDLKEGAFLHAHVLDCMEGSVADFRLERYLVVTNGVRNLYGWLVFEPHCGAYKGTFGDDPSFPSVYEADVNETYTNRLFFSFCRDAETGDLLEKTNPLGDDAYLVLRTRYQTGADGTNGWHYSKLIGPMSIGERLCFKQTIFNPVFNDPNLEYDVSRNLAEGGCAGGGCP